MAIEYKPLRCRSCFRVLAVASETGLTAEDLDAPSCDTCQQFTTFYNAVQAVDREWAEMEPKRDTLKARQVARFKFMQMHMEFDNWLISVEAPMQQYSEPQTQGHGDYTLDKGKSVKHPSPQPQKSTKRAFSNSPSSERPENRTALNGEPDIQADLSLSLRPSPTRAHSAFSLLNRKQLKFSDSVKFRDDYRTCSEYMRADERYVRGRYAPPDGLDYLDTSGSAQTFLKFTGMRRVKGGWVEVTDTETAGKRKRRKTADSAETHEESLVNTLQETNSEEDAPADPRAMRLARRAKDASSVRLPRARSRTTPTRRVLGRKAAAVSRSRPCETMEETTSGVTTMPHVQGDYPEKTREVGALEAETVSKEPAVSCDEDAASVSERRMTRPADAEQAPGILAGLIKPCEEGHGTGTGNRVEAPQTSGKHAMPDASHVQYTIAQPALAEKARVEEEPLACIGEITSMPQPLHSAPYATTCVDADGMGEQDHA